MHVASPAPPDPPAADRPAVAGGELRRRIVRGTVVNGPAAGTLAGIVAAVSASPYPLALRWDPATARRYLRFSAWVLVASLASLVVLQAQVLALDRSDGLRAVGFVTLAATF